VAAQGVQGYAVVANCARLVSWNYTHLAKDETIESVKLINTINRHKAIGIVPLDSL